jgi:vesicle coat complex subunit
MPEQDTQDPNPLIRALAVRTMGCIRVDKITEYLCDPLQRCLKVRMRGCSGGSGDQHAALA